MKKNTNTQNNGKKVNVSKTKATNLGFTLIELLVVIATPTLIALLLPAVQSAR